MKNISSIYMIFLLLISLISCEKGLDTVKVDSTVYLPQSGVSSQTVLLGNSDFAIGVYKAGINQINGNVLVSMGVDQQKADQFISANPGYEMLPADLYTLPSQNVLIGNGTDREYYRIKLKGIDETFINKKYILPIGIKEVDNNALIDTSRNVAILQFVRFRNVYEAKYKAFGRAVLSGTPDTDLLKVDEVVTSTSVNASTIQVKGAVSGMNLLLSVQNGQVQVTGAAGSEAFNIQNTSGKTSTYVGEFNEVYQCNKGTYMIYYTYTTSGKQMDVTAELKFWL